jgi:hypothetical protein
MARKESTAAAASEGAAAVAEPEAGAPSPESVIDAVEAIAPVDVTPVEAPAEVAPPVTPTVTDVSADMITGVAIQAGGDAPPLPEGVFEQIEGAPDFIYVVGRAEQIDGEAVLLDDEEVRTVVLVESLQRSEATYPAGATVMMPASEAERLVALGAAVDPDAPAEVVA